MDELLSLVEQLKKAGIQPMITIAVDKDTRDIQAIKAMLANLKNAGITAQVQINIPIEPAPIGGSTVPGSLPPAGQERLGMRVKEARLNCFSFRKLDKAGKPDMAIVEPRVQMQRGAEFFVSASHRVSKHDSGNGIVFGTGNLEFYLVVECTPNPAAVGLYVRKVDIERTP